MQVTRGTCPCIAIDLQIEHLQHNNMWDKEMHLRAGLELTLYSRNLVTKLGFLIEPHSCFYINTEMWFHLMWLHRCVVPKSEPAILHLNTKMKTITFTHVY